MLYGKKIRKIIGPFEEFCEEAIRGDFVALYLRGSYPRGDWVFGLSDLDFYIIVKDRVLRKSSLKANFDRRISRFLRGVRVANPEFRISLSYDGEMRVLDEKCKSYITSRDSKLLFGEDILGGVPEPDIDEIKSYGKKMAIYLCDYWMSSEELRKRPQTREDAVRIAQYMTLKTAQNALFAREILKFRKSEIAKEFREEYYDFQLKNLVEEAYFIRSKWSLVRGDIKRLEKFLERIDNFPFLFKRYLIHRQGFLVC